MIVPKSLFQGVKQVFVSEYLNALSEKNWLIRQQVRSKLKEKGKLSGQFVKVYPRIQQFQQQQQVDQQIAQQKLKFAFTGIQPFSFYQFAQNTATLEKYLINFFKFQPIRSEIGNKAQKLLKEKCIQSKMAPLFKLIQVYPGKIISGGRDYVKMQNVIKYILYFVDQQGEIVKGNKEIKQCVCEYDIKKSTSFYVENLQLGVIEDIQ